MTILDVRVNEKPEYHHFSYTYQLPEGKGITYTEVFTSREQVVECAKLVEMTIRNYKKCIGL